jgi:glutathione S-transferase
VNWQEWRTTDVIRLHYETTLHPRKACALARHLGSPVEFVHVDFARGEQRSAPFLALNPNGKAPVLEDGDLVLWESNAILIHLSLRSGAGLWPADPTQQVEAMRWMSWENDAFTRHAGALYFEHLIKPRFGLGEPDEKAVADATAAFRRYASVLEAHLDRRAWILGDAMSVVDFSVGATLPYAEAAHIPLRDYPRIAGWHDRLQALPAWREPFPAERRAA